MLYLYDSGAVTPNGSGQGCQDPTTMLEITTPANATVTSLPVTV
ncbi:MAG: hypothetical protein Q8O99_07775 [bacterium]|nr:hypothetical protein [bacterium]